MVNFVKYATNNDQSYGVSEEYYLNPWDLTNIEGSETLLKSRILVAKL